MTAEGTSATRALTVSDLNATINHEPRIRDERLAVALGFARPRDIRPLIERHLEILKTFGEVCGERRKPGTRGGRPGTAFWLNKRQALYITAKSDTERAALVTIEMVEVFDAFTAGRLAPERPALPAPEPPPFCAGCAAREIWNSPLPLSRDGHPLRSGPLTAAELMQVVVFRMAVRKAVQDAAGAAVEQALAAAAARTTLNSPP